MVTPRKRHEIGSLRKALRLLRILNQYDGSSANDLAERVGINRTTAYRLLETMRHAGYVTKDQYDQRYRATSKVGRLSVTSEEPGWHEDILAPALAVLARTIPWPLSVVTVEGGEVIVRHSNNANGSLMGRRMPSGSRLPLLGTAAGLLFLALEPPESRQALLAEAFAQRDREREYLDRFAVLRDEDPAAMDKYLQGIGRNGYAIVEGPDGPAYSIVVPLIHDGRMLAALAVRIIERATPQEVAICDYLPLLQDSAAAMAARITA